MTLHTAILLNGILDFAVIVAVAAAIFVPFTLDRRKTEATMYTFEAPLPDELAA